MTSAADGSSFCCLLLNENQAYGQVIAFVDTDDLIPVACPP